MPEDKSDWKLRSRELILRHEIKKFSKAFKENFITLVISSFGLLTALTWNNFWTAWVNTLSVQNSLTYKFMVAVGITTLAVIMTYTFSRIKDTKI